MGYTHYYYQKRDLTDAEFEGFSSDVSAILAALPKTSRAFDQAYGFGGFECMAGFGKDEQAGVPLAVAHDDPARPIVGADSVHFNGAGYPDADHESFVIDKKVDTSSFTWAEEKMAFDCCKTARKPYDAVVCACLLALKSRAPSAFKISSDGNAGDWVAAARFARHALGRQMPLGKISGFGKDVEAMLAAKQLSGVELAGKESKAIDSAASRARASRKALKAL